jgi:hypothetical protein
MTKLKSWRKNNRWLCVTVPIGELRKEFEFSFFVDKFGV